MHQILTNRIAFSLSYLLIYRGLTSYSLDPCPKYQGTGGVTVLAEASK
jgi:hypothetical protein